MPSILHRSYPAGPTAASINYVATDDKFIPQEPLFSYTYSPPPDGRPQTNERYDSKEVQIEDIRQHPDLTLETVGFQVVPSVTALTEEDFKTIDSNTEDLKDSENNTALKQYHDEIEALLKKTIPGATRVITYNQRTRLHKPKTTLAGYDFTSHQNFPLMRPHIDNTPARGAQIVEELAKTRSRALIVNAWRPIRGVVLDAPLAVTDARTLVKKAKVVNRLLFRDNEKEMFSIRNEGDIHWYFQSAQTPSEVLLFKQYDSERPTHTPAHSAFSDSRYDGEADVLPRFSIETRSIVLFD